MRILIYIYIFAAVALSIWSVITESYPARFFIELLAPEPGDKYPVTITGLLTLISLLLPMIILMAILRLLRNRNEPVDGGGHFDKDGIYFMRLKQAQNRLIASPIFINGEERGRIDSGKNLFIELSPGTYEVQVGRKSEKSDQLIAQVELNKRTHVEISIVPNGLRSKYVVELV